MLPEHCNLIGVDIYKVVCVVTSLLTTRGINIETVVLIGMKEMNLDFLRTSTQLSGIGTHMIRGNRGRCL